MSRAVLVLLALALAGCADDAETTRTDDVVEEDLFVLRGALDVAEITPGETVAATFSVENRGADATFVVGGCGSAPWVYEILAEDGARVGPVPPDPRCLGAPDETRALMRGGELGSELRWDGYAKERDPSGEILREPAAPGLYTLRASVALQRGDVPSEPTLELRVRVT